VYIKNIYDYINLSRTYILLIEKMSTNMDSKEKKAKELMKKCSDQFPECPVISTAEILSIMNGKNKDIDNASKSVLLVDVRRYTYLLRDSACHFITFY
jgi:hypothetical protein